jgi:hypothetical protein
MTDFETILPVPIRQDNPRRISQREIQPSAVKERSLGEIFSITGTTSFSSIITLGNGEEVNIDFTFTHEKKYDLLIVEPYISIYIGTIASANRLPDGSAVTESQWIFNSPTFNYDQWDGHRYSSVISIYIRNVSAGAGQVIAARVKSKFISRTSNF